MFTTTQLIELAAVLILLIIVPIIFKGLEVDKRRPKKFPGKPGVRLPREYKRKHILR